MTDVQEQPSPVKVEEVTPQLEEAQPEPTPEKPKPKRYVRKKAAVPTPEVPPASPEPIPEVPPPCEQPAKPKAKPRAKKATKKEVVIDTEEVQAVAPPTEIAPPPEHQETVVKDTDPFDMTAKTTLDTRTPKQQLMDLAVEMKRVKREAKQTHYKRMLEGKI